ncbi:unnamed protein product [Schistosoma turkestanicum]|nr:unnamed protein product [Schistosoma turkestanicum]
MHYLKNKYTNWNSKHFPELQQFRTVESSCAGLSFHHARPRDFVTSQWMCFTSKYFTIYRVLLAILLFVWIIYDIVSETMRHFDQSEYGWITYGTNWAFLLLTITHISLALYCLIYNIKYSNNEPRYYQPIWFINNISSTCMLVVCVIFWFSLSNIPLSVFTSWQSRVKHSLTPILVLIDTCLCAIPIRMIHVIYPCLVGLIYSLFTYLFWLLGGAGPYDKGQVYPSVDWSKPIPTVLVCLCALMAAILCHVILYIIYFIRVNISAKLGGRGYMLIRETMEQHCFDNEEFDLDEGIGKIGRQTIESKKIQNAQTDFQKYGTV